MTIEELEKKLTELNDLRLELREQIKELKLAMAEKEKPTPPHPRWKPNEGEEYYVIGTCGDVCLQGWTNDDIDNKRLSYGNIFMTREAAKIAAERRKVLAEMQEWAGENNDGAYIYYHKPYDDILIDWDGDSTYYHGDIRFKCVDDADNCIKAVGEERLKKYYFMIPEV